MEINLYVTRAQSTIVPPYGSTGTLVSLIGIADLINLFFFWGNQSHTTPYGLDLKYCVYDGRVLCTPLIKRLRGWKTQKAWHIYRSQRTYLRKCKTGLWIRQIKAARHRLFVGRSIHICHTKQNHWDHMFLVSLQYPGITPATVWYFSPNHKYTFEILHIFSTLYNVLFSIFQSRYWD